MDEQGQEFGMWLPGAPEGGMGKGALDFTGGLLAFLGLEKVLRISHPSPLHALGKRDDPQRKERSPSPPLS